MAKQTRQMQQTRQTRQTRPDKIWCIVHTRLKWLVVACIVAMHLLHKKGEWATIGILIPMST